MAPLTTRDQTKPAETGRILYLDPWSGVSGDMLLAALIDLDPEGRAERMCRDTVASLALPGVRVDVKKEASGGLACTRVDVTCAEPPPLRTLHHLQAILDASDLPSSLRERAAAALTRLAEVEADLHGVAVEQVHFHEIGAVDTLVDVVAVMALVDALGVDDIVHAPVPVGAGSVTTDHGELGVPAPAALALLVGRPILAGRERNELTTPTGALLLGHIGARCAPLPEMVVEAVGYGGGTRELAHGPNVLRAILGRVAGGGGRASAAGDESLGVTSSKSVVLLEAVIDDSSPEVLAYLHQMLLAGGALDAWWTAVFVKKGRVASELTVLCRPEDEAALVDTIFRESTTFGVRRAERSRHVLDREWCRVEVEGQPVRVKIGRLRGEAVTVAPEFDDAQRAASCLGVPLKEIMAAAAEAARLQMGVRRPGPSAI